MRTPPGSRSSTAAAVVALAFMLAGCPLPQPVPAVEGSVSITPPRILTASAVPQEATVIVGTQCAPEQYVPFGATVDDPDLEETVEARWFVDYASDAPGVQQNDFPAAAVDGTATQRPLADFRFFPARYATAGTHVVEVVVSNGFYSIGGDPPGSAEPNRTPQPGYETQLFRWTVIYDSSGRCQ